MVRTINRPHCFDPWAQLKVRHSARLTPCPFQATHLASLKHAAIQIDTPKFQRVKFSLYFSAFQHCTQQLSNHVRERGPDYATLPASLVPFRHSMALKS
jgi:hypothetical protein